MGKGSVLTPWPASLAPEMHCAGFRVQHLQQQHLKGRRGNSASSATKSIIFYRKWNCYELCSAGMADGRQHRAPAAPPTTAASASFGGSALHTHSTEGAAKCWSLPACPAGAASGEYALLTTMTRCAGLLDAAVLCHAELPAPHYQLQCHSCCQESGSSCSAGAHLHCAAGHTAALHTSLTHNKCAAGCSVYLHQVFIYSAISYLKSH